MITLRRPSATRPVGPSRQFDPDSRRPFGRSSAFGASALLFIGVLLLGAVQAIASSGAIFTTTSTGTVVNANIYTSKQAVYLNGGPQGNCTSAGLPTGDYYFQVTDPSGAVLLSTDAITERRVGVSGGAIRAYRGSTHATSAAGSCPGSITVALFPYNDTPNSGGEYKVWMTPVTSYAPGSGKFGFRDSESKTDNFKVRTGSTPPPPPLPPLTCQGSVDTNRNPFGVGINPLRGEALVANQDSRSVSLVNLATRKEIWEITVGRRPFGVAVNPVTNVGVVSLRDEAAVAIIDLTTKVVTKVPVTGHPMGVDIDPGYNVAVVVSQPNIIALIDLSTKTTIISLTIASSPWGVAINPNTHVAGVTNQGDGSVVFLDYTFVTNPITTAVVPLPRNKLQCRQSPGPQARPAGIAFDYADTTLNRAVVADPGTGNLVIIDLDADSNFVGLKTLGPLPGIKPQKPLSVAVNPGLDFGIVTGDGAGAFAFTLTKPAFTATLGGCNRKPQNVAIDTLSCRAVVTNRGASKQTSSQKCFFFEDKSHDWDSRKGWDRDSEWDKGHDHGQGWSDDDDDDDHNHNGGGQCSSNGSGGGDDHHNGGWGSKSSNGWGGSNSGNGSSGHDKSCGWDRSFSWKGSHRWEKDFDSVPDKSKSEKTGNVVVVGLACSPVITAVNPPSLQAGSTVVITITGSGLLPGTTVNVGGTGGIPSQPVGPGVIRATIVAPGPPGTYQVSVTVNGRTSNTLPIATTTLPPPVLCSLTTDPQAPAPAVPPSAIASGGDLTLTLLANNIVAPATGVFGGTAGLPAVQILSITNLPGASPGACAQQQIVVKIAGYPVTLLTSHASVPPPTISIINPGGGSSNALPVPLLNPVPSISDIQPHASDTSTLAKEINLFGINFTLDGVNNIFTTQTQVLFNGVPLALVQPDFVEPTSHLRVTVPASLLTLPVGQTSIRYSISVLNPPPGGGTYPPVDSSGNQLPFPCPTGTTCTGWPTFTVSAPNVPAANKVSSVDVNPGGSNGPTQVALLKDWPTAGKLTGVAGIGNEVRLRLVDLTNAQSPTLIASPNVLLPGTPSFGGIGHMKTLPDALPGQTPQKAVVLTLPNDSLIATVNYSVTDGNGQPTIDTYQLLDSSQNPVYPLYLAVDSVNNKLVVVNEATSTLQIFDIILPPTNAVTRTTLSSSGTIDLSGFLRYSTPDLQDPDRYQVTTLAVPALNPATGLVAVLDSPDAPYTGGLIVANYLNPATGLPRPTFYATGDSTPLALGYKPSDIAIDPTTNEALIVETNSDQLRVVNLANGSTRAVVPLITIVGRSGPEGVALDPVTHKAVIVGGADNVLYKVNLNPAVPTTSNFGISAGGAQGPYYVVWDPASGTVFASTLINSVTSAIVVSGVTPATIP